MIKTKPGKWLLIHEKLFYLFFAIGLAFSAIFSTVVFAQSQSQTFCFASAASYYEQVYCELQARGEVKNLPPFYQFKRNDAMTQALLLKRPALRAGIDLPMPKTPPTAAKKNTVKTDQQVPSSTASKLPRPTHSPTHIAAPAANKLSCRMADVTILCNEQRFALTGNLKNQRLAAGVLDAEHKMSLPVYGGSYTDQAAVNQYLAKAYRQYLEKMHRIGLGGVTMTYAKFDFLFFDLHEKGLNFSQRFDTMYDYLKKDKAKMAVSEKVVANQQLTFEDCDFLPETMFVCSRSGRNYLYLSVSE
jgi:hypothetical protein